MSETDSDSSTNKQLLPDGLASWSDYWTAQSKPWRTQPEISEERKSYLAERRVVKPNLEKGIYPFRDDNGAIKLDRADVEWLLATHDSGGIVGPVEWMNVRHREREGVDLRGADLRGCDLSDLPLALMRGALGPTEWRLVGPKERSWAATKLAGADLRRVHLEGSIFMWGQLEGADFFQGNLQGSFFNTAHLERADLRAVHLEGAHLNGAHLEGANLRDAHLEGADLHGVFLNPETSLNRAIFGSPKYGVVSVADVNWGGANLAVLSWEGIGILGDELEARNEKNSEGKRRDSATRLTEFERAVRANRQLATALRTQGLNEYADRFFYRSQVCQRLVLLRQQRYLRYFGSLLLGITSGYGYRPLRSVYTYLVVILGFAAAYFTLTNFAITPSLHSRSSQLAWYEAIVLSISAFHGRGLFPTGLSLGDPIVILAALEAVVGLLIEITFIATFTQRLFAR